MAGLKQSIKLSTDQMRLISLFQSVTKAGARDCIEDGDLDRVIFVVEPGMMREAIGRGGSHIRSLQNMVKRSVELVEYDGDPVRFLTNLLGPKLVTGARVEERPDGSRQAVVTVDPSKKGLAVGREGRNAKRARLLAKRYFGIDHVVIAGQERPALEL